MSVDTKTDAVSDLMAWDAGNEAVQTDEGRKTTGNQDAIWLANLRRDADQWELELAREVLLAMHRQYGYWEQYGVSMCVIQALPDILQALAQISPAMFDSLMEKVRRDTADQTSDGPDQGN